jgi:Family of unknown function (DUF6325)
VSKDAIDEMGPIDYVVIEWPAGTEPSGEGVPILIDLVERGIVRVLDFAFVTKGDDGSVAAVEISELGERAAALKDFEGASSGLLSDDDIDDAGEVLETGSSAALIVYENRWAAPFASAVRSSGAQLVSSGRIPADALMSALDAAEAA